MASGGGSRAGDLTANGPARPDRNRCSSSLPSPPRQPLQSRPSLATLGGMPPSSGAPLPPHTSELLEQLVAKAPDGPVDLEWLLGHLDKRSFGLLLLLLGLLVIVPGVASIASLI